MTDFYQEENIYLLETVLKVCMKSYANVCQSSLGEYILEELIFILFYFIFLFFFWQCWKGRSYKAGHSLPTPLLHQNSWLIRRLFKVSYRAEILFNVKCPKGLILCECTITVLTHSF